MKRFRHFISTSLLFATMFMQSIAQDEVSTGPDPLFSSDVRSIYMRGMNADKAAEPVRIRILGARASMGSVIAQVLVLDDNGNFIRDADQTASWSASYACRGEPMSTSATATVNEKAWRSMTSPSVIEIVIDNSLTSFGTAPIALRALRDQLPGFVGRDSVGVITYSHLINEVTDITSVSEAALRCNPDSLDDASGLAATYAAMMTGLQKLEDHPQSSRTLVVVTASNDASSLPSTLTRVLRKANELQATIHVIKVGQSVQGYIYRYLSAATGGKLYALSGESVEDVALILREIAYGSKQHFEVTIPITMIPPSCDDLLIKISAGIEGTSSIFADTILVPRREKQFYQGRSIVATFPDTTERGLQEYYPILSTLAEELMADPTKRLQLVGHVSADIKGDADKRATERAGSVAGFLKAYGVKETQLSISSDGNRKPLYYLQLDETQRLMNNRVEAYFINEDDLPYTVVVDQVATEEQAVNAVETWESRGYKSYFEPIVLKRSPAYRVKLWGYRTRKEAEKAVASIRKYSKSTAFIE